MLSLPDSWVVNIGALSRRFGETESKISRALKDLIAQGYCKRTPKRENGRVCGQRYQITDIRNDFSDPSIFKGAENKTDEEIAVSVENEGYNKNINNKNIYINKQEEKKRGVNASNPHDEPLCLFADSRFADFEKFAAEFAGDDFAGVDIRYYYEVLSNWSASKRAKKNDWIATAKNWMMRDFKEGKLVRCQPVMEDWKREMIMRDRANDAEELWPDL